MTQRRWHGVLLALGAALAVILCSCALPDPIPVAPKDQGPGLSSDSGISLDQRLKVTPDGLLRVDSIVGCRPSDARVDGQCRPADARIDGLRDGGKDLSTDAIKDGKIIKDGKSKDGKSTDVSTGD
jgi:hypothetical protein